MPPTDSDVAGRLMRLETIVDTFAKNAEAQTAKLDAILGKLSDIARIEERQAQTQSDTQAMREDNARLWVEVNAAKSRVHDLELEITSFTSYAKGQSKLILAMLTLAGGIFVKLLFFASANGMHL